MIQKKRPSYTLCLFFLALSCSAHSEFKNNSYSHFSIGSSNVTYSESLGNFAGTTFESDFSTNGVSQRSGGYTAVAEDSRYGFIIATQSTLIASEGLELWNANWDHDDSGSNDGVKTVQTDQASLNQANLDLLAVYHLKNGVYFLAGMHYQKISFTRFDFQSTSHTSNFSDYTLDNSTTYINLKDEIENGSGSVTFSDGTTVTTDADLRDALRFNPEAQTPVVAEDLTSFNIVGGIGYDSFFVDRKPGVRYKAHLYMGTPLYLHVLNTNVGGTDRSLSEVLSGGIDLSSTASIGYQFSEKISVMGSLTVLHAERESISVTNSAGQKVSLPDNTFTAIIPELTFFWAF